MYQQPAPVRSGSNPTKIVLLVLLFVGVPCLIGGFLLVKVFQQSMGVVSSSIMPLVSCAQNLEFLQKASTEYALAHDGKLPGKDTWQSDLEPYYRKLAQKMGDESANVFGTKFEVKPLPKDGVWSCQAEGPQTGIAYNSNVAGKKLAEIKDKSTVVFFEAMEAGKNLAAAYQPLDPKKAPRMFGENRQWLRIQLDGQGVSEFKNGSMKIKSKTDVSLGTDPSKKNDEPATEPK